MIELIGATAVLVCASLVVGRAAAVAIGLKDVAVAAPVLGLALLLIGSNATIAFGGAGLAVALVLVAIVVASACFVLLRRSTLRTSRARRIGGVVAAVTSFVVAALPFWCERGAGTLGVSVLDDIANHQYLAWALQQRDPYAVLITGYPIAPHSLVAGLATVTFSNIGIVFSAYLLAVPVLSALTVYSLLRNLGTVLAVVASILVPLTYLAASLLGEGAFKEPTVALCMLGFAALFREARTIRAAIAFGILTAACLLVMGRTGAIWPVMCCVFFALFTTIEAMRLKLPDWRGRARQAAIATGAGVATTLVLVLPELRSVMGFSPDHNGSNVLHNVSIAEAFGIWGNVDFRTPHTSILVAPSLTAIGVLLFVGGLAWFLLRLRDASLPAVALAGLAVYGFVLIDSANPYLRVKALMVAAVPIAAVIFGALFDFSAERSVRERARALGVVRPVFAIVFAATAFWCTLLVLRDAPVQQDANGAELASIRATVQGQPTAFLVADAFGWWKLRGADVTAFTSYYQAPHLPLSSVSEPSPFTIPADGFAGVAGKALDRYRFAVTTNAAYYSAPPPNWLLVASTRHYLLWRRTAMSPVRLVRPDVDAGLVRPTCQAGAFPPDAQAETRPVSVFGPQNHWTTFPHGGWLPSTGWHTSVNTGTTVQQTLDLAPGRWEIDLQYQTPTALTVQVDGAHFGLPQDLDVFGPYWKAGTIESHGGRTKILVTLHRRPFPSEQRSSLIGAVVAVRVDSAPRLLPIRKACGTPVEWVIARA